MPAAGGMLGVVLPQHFRAISSRIGSVAALQAGFGNTAECGHVHIAYSPLLSTMSPSSGNASTRGAGGCPTTMVRSLNCMGYSAPGGSSALGWMWPIHCGRNIPAVTAADKNRKNIKRQKNEKLPRYGASTTYNSTGSGPTMGR